MKKDAKRLSIVILKYSRWLSINSTRSGLDTNVPLVPQIDSWLAHLPSDMESYIRPGCLVLTIFVSMPTSEWTEVQSPPLRPKIVIQTDLILHGARSIHLLI